MSEEVQQEDDKLNEEDVPGIIYYLIESFNSIDAMDTGLMGKQDKQTVEGWKNKIWGTLDYYIKILPSGDL